MPWCGVNGRENDAWVTRLLVPRLLFFLFVTIEPKEAREADVNDALMLSAVGTILRDYLIWLFFPAEN